MKKHSQEFKDKIKEFGRQIDSQLTFGETVLGNEQLNAVTPVLQSSLLKSVMKELDIDSNVEIPVGTILNYKFGVLLDSGDYEYLDYGNYQVYSIKKQEDTNSYNIVAYDKMLNSMADYVELKDKTKQFPMTIRDYIEAICNDIGLTFKNKNDEFANYNRVIESDLYANLNYTYRDILDELAQVTASNIIINENDELEIKYITDTNDMINEEYLKDINVAFGEKYGPINSIVLSRSAGADNVYLQDEQSVADNGLHELKISDNQIMNFNDRSDYLPDILEKLNGLEFYINDFSSTGVGYYEVADRYNVKISDNTYACVMFNDEIQVTQGLEEIIHTDLPEQAETDYTKADKTDRKINQTYLIVDKQNQTIQSVVEKVNDVQMYVEGYSLTNNLEIEDVYEGQPLNIKVQPIKTDIPENTLLKFKNLNNNEEIKYNLPCELLYKDSNLYDEFEIDSETHKCFKIKRLKKDEIQEVNVKVGDIFYNGMVKFYFPENYDWITRKKIVELEDLSSNRLINIYTGNDEISISFYMTSGIFETTLNKENHVISLTALTGKKIGKITYIDEEASENGWIKGNNSNYGKGIPIETPETIEFDYPDIPLKTGNYNIYLDGDYPEAYIYGKFYKASSYMALFATKTELKQTSDSISASVSGQFNDLSGEIKDVNGQLDLYIRKNDKDEVVSAFNANFNEVVITSNNFNLSANGDVNANNLTATNGNFSGNITGSNISGSIINGGEIHTIANDAQFTVENADRTKRLAFRGNSIGYYEVTNDKYWWKKSEIIFQDNNYVYVDGHEDRRVERGSCRLNQTDTTVYFREPFLGPPTVILQCKEGSGNQMYYAHVGVVTGEYFVAYVPIVGLNDYKNFDYVAIVS